LLPGLAFGGSCLPKEFRALTHFATAKDVDVPMLANVLAANERQIERALRRIESKPHKRIGVLGLSFKAGTDDLRESPLVELVERLIGKGFEVVIYDSDLQLSRLVGSNRRFAMQHLPHLSGLLVADLEDALERSDIVVVGTPHASFRNLLPLLRPDHQILDLAGHDISLREHPSYEGVCW
jgi:GDP-mannose 6-dehydrogenase